MKRFLAISAHCFVSTALYEVALAHFFREPSLTVALDRGWYASGGVLVTLIMLRAWER